MQFITGVRKMKILFVSNLYPPVVYGGYERLCFLVAEELKKQGHEICVLTSNYGEIKKSANEEYPVYRYLQLFTSKKSIYEPADYTEKERIIISKANNDSFDSVFAKEKPDLVFVWNLYFLNRDLFEHIDTNGKQVCYFLTDNWLISFLNDTFLGNYFSQDVYGKISKSLIYRMKALVKKIISKESASLYQVNGNVIFPSEFMRGLYLKAGISFKNAQIIYHGMNFLENMHENRVARINLSKKKKIKLLFAGRIVEIKGTHTAIEAVKILQKRNLDKEICLTIIGDMTDTDYIDSLKKRIKALNIEKSVEFLPAIPEKELFNCFQQYDIYLFPSLYEPFSLTLILALEAGIPTIASDAGGNNEIVFQKKTGLLFEKHNAFSMVKQIETYINDFKLYKEVSHNAHEYASNFTFDRMVEEILAYLKKLKMSN